MKLRSCLTVLVAMAVLAGRAPAQATTGAADPVGVWRGTSLCQVRPSRCNDEVVVFRITRANATDSVSLDGRKVVNGQEEEMGILACRFAATDASLTCAIPQGVWHFAIRRDSLVGELTLSDGSKVRDVRTARSR